MFPPTNEITTEFNAAIHRLQTLNKLIDRCNDYSRACYSERGFDIEALKIWKTTLRIIYLEINAKLSDPQRKIIDDLFNEDKNIGNIVTSKKSREGVTKIINKTNFSDHWEKLYEIDKNLRLLADKKGMLMINKDGMFGAIGE